MRETRPTETIPKDNKRISLAVLIFSALVFGFIAGLGGSLLLSHSLIRRPLAAQQEKIQRQNQAHQEQLELLNQKISSHQEEIKTLGEEIQRLMLVDRSRYLKELGVRQKESSEQTQALIKQMTQLQHMVTEMQNSHAEFNKTMDKAKRDLDRTDKSLRDDVQLLRSSLNDLESKIQQMERQLTAK